MSVTPFDPSQLRCRPALLAQVLGAPVRTPGPVSTGGWEVKRPDGTYRVIEHEATSAFDPKDAALPDPDEFWAGEEHRTLYVEGSDVEGFVAWLQEQLTQRVALAARGALKRGRAALDAGDADAAYEVFRDGLALYAEDPRLEDAAQVAALLMGSAHAMKALGRQTFWVEGRAEAALDRYERLGDQQGIAAARAFLAELGA